MSEKMALPIAEPDRGAWIKGASKEEIASIIDNLPCGVAINETAVGKVLYVNNAILEITGYPVSDVPDSEAAIEKFSLDEEARQVELKRREEIFRTRRGTISGPLRCKNGEIKTVEVAYVLLQDDKALAVWTDATRREKAEKALLQIKDELEDRVRERTSELLAVNERLVKEIESRKAVENELKQSREELR